MIARRVAGTALAILGAGALAFSLVKLTQGDFPGLLLPTAGVLLVLAGLGLFDRPGVDGGPKP